MNTPNPKRPRYGVSSSIQNPNSLSIAPDFNQSDFDSTIYSLLLLPDSPSTSIGCSFDRALGQVISSASDDDSVQDRLIDHARKLASLLHESIDRFSRNRATLYNSNSWSLPHELTVKVFSMLDSKSLCKLAGCCSMFRKCSMDPLCYSHIDFRTTTKRIKDEVVFTMIHRAGKELRSLKLGLATSPVIPSLTTTLLYKDLLRSLHFCCVYNMHAKSICNVLSACPNLTDLKIFNFDKEGVLQKLLKSGTRYDRLIEYLSKLPATGISSSEIETFVTYCPNLTSLTLYGFNLNEEMARNLALGFPKLNYMNLSRTPGISGRFLSDLENSGRDKIPLKTVILRDCPSLKNEYVMQFLISLITGSYFSFIRHIDVSTKLDLNRNEGSRISIPKNLVTMLKEKRSDVTFVESR